ncbi:tetratricopeptide-like helical domain-containing protein [Artemisia annua]|uniref:Tetratricopeptide-like helical domain-containing protein n=1 Tax=Artemisia annua TaxID=35608 RepID=A0A2U1Q082_ARTAN|nr:tetratricopeptide-like helical domain-containing protein [Artemisia annua]
MLGRAGLLKEAYGLISEMPIEANSVMWRAFLAACRVHGNGKLAEIAVRNVIELEPEHCGSYVLMSNVYGATGRYEEVFDVRDNMRQQNVKKTLGCSWIEFRDGVHVFGTGDRAHPAEELIYNELRSLYMTMGLSQTTQMS